MIVAIFGILGLILFGTNKVSKADIMDDWNKYDSLFKKYGTTYKVPWKWIKSICIIESNLGRATSVKRGLENPSDAESSKSSDGKSWGLMQLTLGTAAIHRKNVTVTELNNPEISVELGTRELARLIKYFGGLAAREKVIRAYNGGAGYMTTKLGREMTPIYYDKFKRALIEVMSKDGSDELSFG